MAKNQAAAVLDAETRRRLRVGKDFTPVLAGTPEKEHLLSIGYDGLTVEQALEIVEARAKNPMSYPFELERKAKAFLAAYEAEATVVATRPMWKRQAAASAY